MFLKIFSSDDDDNSVAPTANPMKPTMKPVLKS